MRLYMPGSITFSSGNASVDSSFFPVLKDVALVINKYEKTTLMVEGHTDNTGADDMNQRLSEARANSVKNYLVQNGVDNRRVSTLGMGEYTPIADNTTQAGRQKNRRVELKIIPMSKD